MELSILATASRASFVPTFPVDKDLAAFGLVAGLIGVSGMEARESSSSSGSTAV